MNKICTSIKQSQKLIELGIDIKTADMCWSIDIPDLPTLLAYPITDCDNWENKISAWSLAALINVLPQFIKFRGDKYYLRFMKEYVEYANDEISITGRCLHTIGNDNLVDACYEMIIKLHELNLL